MSILLDHDVIDGGQMVRFIIELSKNIENGVNLQGAEIFLPERTHPIQPLSFNAYKVFFYRSFQKRVSPDILKTSWETSYINYSIAVLLLFLRKIINYGKRTGTARSTK